MRLQKMASLKPAVTAKIHPKLPQSTKTKMMMISELRKNQIIII